MNTYRILNDCKGRNNDEWRKEWILNECTGRNEWWMKEVMNTYRILNDCKGRNYDEWRMEWILTEYWMNVQEELYGGMNNDKGMRMKEGITMKEWMWMKEGITVVWNTRYPSSNPLKLYITWNWITYLLTWIAYLKLNYLPAKNYYRNVPLERTVLRDN